MTTGTGATTDRRLDGATRPRSGRRVAIVSGAASGIGAATVTTLTDRGFVVAGFDLAPVPGAARGVAVDVSDGAAVADAVADVRAALGPIDTVVSCAGHYEMVPVAEISPQQWRRMLAVHLGGLLNLARACLPDMLDAGTGCVVAIASELAIGGGAGDAHYAAAKGAVIGLVRSLAVEVADRGVRVNCVAPGPTDTPLLPADSPWRAADYLATLPLGRLARPGEIARCIEFLVCDATFCVGEVVDVNCGAVI